MELVAADVDAFEFLISDFDAGLVSCAIEFR
jgi:hypothetical protein